MGSLLPDVVTGFLRKLFPISYPSTEFIGLVSSAALHVPVLGPRFRMGVKDTATEQQVDRGAGTDFWRHMYFACSSAYA